jgi:hypothetical protein
MGEMNNKKTAIFFNVAGIQKYVFNTNKLKHIIRASSIINSIYEPLRKYDSVEIGFIGGGDALLFVENVISAQQIVKDFTLHVLKTYPEIVFRTAIQEGFFREAPHYQEKLHALKETAEENLNQNRPITALPKHGITADCPFSGLSAEVMSPIYKKYVSKSIQVKLNDNLRKKIKSDDNLMLKDAAFDNTYTFADEFADMGQEKGLDSHIAIVHIDGNGIGKLFSYCESLSESQDLDKNNKEITKNAFVEVLKKLKTLVVNKLVLPIIRNNKRILPLRPIILDGDDITFVCNSFLGIWLAKSFMDSYSKVAIKQLGGKHANKTFTACAGVVVTKTNYPFYRGYELAEELCQNAKKIFRYHQKKHDNPFESNWLDFHLAQTDIPASLDEIRKKQFVDANGDSILMRPYNDKQLDECIHNALKLRKKLPEGWGKELREVLYLGESDWKMWQKKAQWRKKEYQIDKDKTMQDKRAYFDLIEMNEIIKPEYFPEHFKTHIK